VLHEAVSRNLESCCDNYGSAFGWWGAKVCPDDFASVEASVNAESNVASGGKSGAKVIITPKFVIKTINQEEMTEFRKLVEKLRSKPGHEGDMSFLAPTCRAVKIGVDQYLQIMANSLFQKKSLHGQSYIFDLKGNFGALARKASYGAGTLKDNGETTLKDRNFNDVFPGGMMIEKARIKNADLSGDQAAIAVITTMIKDTASLKALKLLDYSILADVVDLCPDSIRVTSKSNFTAFNENRELQLTDFHKSVLRPRDRHARRPIYANDQGEYIYYWKAWGEWQIGVDYMTQSRGLTVKSVATCPTSAGPWHAILDRNTRKFTTEPQISLVDISTESVEARLLRENPDIPFLWMYGVSGSLQYLVTFSIIDVLMQEESRGLANLLGSGLSFSTCKTYDIDPIPADEYRVRFLRMFGYKDPQYKTSDGMCGGCLWPNIFQSEYTYFRSVYQQSQHKDKACEWGA